jgi:hypothetical protein
VPRSSQRQEFEGEQTTENAASLLFIESSFSSVSILSVLIIIIIIAFGNQQFPRILKQKASFSVYCPDRSIPIEAYCCLDYLFFSSGRVETGFINLYLIIRTEGKGFSTPFLLFG